MKLSKEKQQQLLLVAMGVVLVIAVLYMLIISRQKEQIATLAATCDKVQADVDKAKKTIKSKDIELEILTSRSNELATIESTLASGGDKYAWFRQTWNRFRMPYQTRVETPFISQPNIGPAAMYGEFPYLTASFNVRGTAHYHDLGRLLMDFENKFPCFRVQKLNISPAEGADTPEKLNFEMEVVTLVNPK